MTSRTPADKRPQFPTVLALWNRGCPRNVIAVRCKMRNSTVEHVLKVFREEDESRVASVEERKRALVRWRMFASIGQEPPDESAPPGAHEYRLSRSLGIEPIVRFVPNRVGIGSHAPGFVPITLPRIRAIEEAGA